MKQKLHQPFVNGSKTQRSGSVLLVTLFVVALLMVVVMTFSVYVRLSLREVIVYQHNQEARAAARLGMNLALGELQHVAGPDQRVTARSDLFSGVATYSNLVSLDEKSKWTGVWDTTNVDELDPSSKQFRRWLVSGDVTDLERLEYTGEALSGETVLLVGDHTVSNTVNHVRVAKEEIQSGPSGALAWWVGDENIKARWNTTNPFRGTTDDLERLFTLRGAQTAGMETMIFDIGAVTPGNEENYFVHNNPDMLKTVVPKQIPFSAPTDAATAAYQVLSDFGFHTISLHSAGLLTDTKNGGLKRDLSLAFEMPYTEWERSFFVNDNPDAEIPRYQPLNYPQNIDGPGTDNSPDMNASLRRGRQFAPMVAISDFSPYGFTPEASEYPENPVPVPYQFISGVERTGNGFPQPKLRGPSWDIARNFYRLYKDTDTDRARFGLPTQSGVREVSGNNVIQGISAFPPAEGLQFSRRYGMDTLVDTYVEMFGPDGTNYTQTMPIGRTLVPGVAPVLTRIQHLISFSARDVGGGNFQLDLYLDPVVTLWNPYDVYLETGSDESQPIELSVMHFDELVQVRVTPPGLGSPVVEGGQAFGDLDGTDRSTDRYFNRNSLRGRYNRFGEEAFRLRLDFGGRRMAPGEVLVFSMHSSQEYRRNESTLPGGNDEFGQKSSGVMLTLTPGMGDITSVPSITNPTGGTGIYVRNILAGMDEVRYDNDYGWALRGGDPFPGGVITYDSQVEFRVIPHLEFVNLKYQLRAMIARDTSNNVRGPFMGSLQAPINEMETDWSSPDTLVQDLLNAKQVHSYFDVHLKHANSESPVNFLAHYNPRTPSFQQGTTQFMESSAYLPEVDDVEEDTWWAESLTIADPDGLIDMVGDNGFWGEDNDASGATHIALFSVPSVPLLSLGGLQHMPTTMMVDEPAFPIGNSWVHPFVGLSKLSFQALNPDNNQVTNADGRTPERTNYNMTRADWSYLLNDVLWDGFYFSGLTPLDLQDAASTVRERWEDHLAYGTPLLNSAYRVMLPSDVDPIVIRDNLFYSSNNAAEEIRVGDPKRTADEDVSKYLLVDGMFNVNSTSVEAWKSLLASARKPDVRTVSGLETAMGSVFTRFDRPMGTENENWDGYRSLTDTQIQRLAEEIVIQVRERGPFMSLSEFVNRRVASTPDPSGGDYHVHMESGALQAAIDASGINAGRFTDTLRNQGLNPAAINPWVRDRLDQDSETAMGANGYLTQADVLSVIGPLLSARSDTFTIRSYGEINNDSGELMSRAWCEAVVQRIPYEDSSYGDGVPRRGFKILSFRWLNNSDI